MANNTYKNKVVYNGTTLIDLTGDTVTAANLAQGVTAHDASGAPITGSMTGGTDAGDVWQDAQGYVHLDDEAAQAVTHPDPEVSINTSAGLITATHTQSSGLVTGGTTTDTLQLSTQSGTTISPTESEQTAVAAGKYTLGAVKVGAISSTYVGSGIDRNDSTDLSASGATVTVPAGYYASQASKSVASGTAGTPTATKGTVSNHSVSVTPSVTNTAGYISGGTVNGTAVTVSASELASGNKEITSNGTNIDVVGYSTVSVDVSGGNITVDSLNVTQNGTYTAQTGHAYSPVTVNVSGGSVNLKMGVIRPDAELIQTWSEDVLVVEDLGVTIPNYSTSAQTLRSVSDEVQTVTLDIDNYNYFVLQRSLTTPIYTSSVSSYYHQRFYATLAYYELTDWLPEGIETSDGISVTNISTRISVVGQQLYLNTYQSSSNYLYMSTTDTYGCYQNNAAVTYTSSTKVLKARKFSIGIRGYYSYLPSEAWDCLTDIRVQRVAQLYRVPYNNNGLKGWAINSQWKSILNDVANNNGTLT